MRLLTCLFCLVWASPVRAQSLEVYTPEQIFMGAGYGRELGRSASWWTLESSISRWRLVYDSELQDFSRFDLGLNLGQPNFDALWWFGFSFNTPHNDRPPGLYPRIKPGEGGQGFFFGQYLSEYVWLEGRYPLADTSDGLSWPWSVDLRELRVGRARFHGGNLQAVFKAGYHSEKGGYSGLGLKYSKGRTSFSLDSLDGLSVEYSTEITGR